MNEWEKLWQPEARETLLRRTTGDPALACALGMFVGCVNADLLTGDFFDEAGKQVRRACTAETLMLVLVNWNGCVTLEIDMKFVHLKVRGVCEDGTARFVTWNRVCSVNGVWRKPEKAWVAEHAPRDVRAPDGWLLNDRLKAEGKPIFPVVDFGELVGC